MKIRQLMIAMLGVFAMTACTQTDRAQESAESGEVPPSISSAQIAIHGNLKLCDPFASGGAATLNGYYYTVLRPDGNLNIHYLDYATHSDIILCSRPNCTHDDESCSSFIQSNSLVPSLAVVGDRLLIVGGGIGVSDPEEGDLPYIEVMQLDGNDRKRVYQANASSEFGALVCDDQNFYTVERITKIQDDIPILTQHIAQIDLNTGEKTVLSDMGTNIVYAKSSKDALAALRLLKGLYEGTATIKGEKKSFPKQDISDIDMEDLTNKIALWTDICTLEKKLNVSFDPSAPMPQEDLEFLYQLRACLLCHKKIAWKHPFSKLHLTQTSQSIHEIESLVGKDDISLNFDEGPISCTLLGTSFELYSKTELRHILITSIDWTDDNKSSADLYIADSSSRSWELLRAFVTTDEYLNNSSRHKLASS